MRIIVLNEVTKNYLERLKMTCGLLTCIGRACSMHGRTDKLHTKLWSAEPERKGSLRGLQEM
jgi:hypothetical protein